MDTLTKQFVASGFWRLLESPLLTALIGEPALDFYGGLLSPRLTARRIIAQVEAVREETPSVKSFVLKPNGHFRGFRAGQHVNVTVEIDGVRHTRCYSPSNAPDHTRQVVLTVKRHLGGLVSPWLHEHLRAGDCVELAQAFGDFALPASAAKLLFIAGGSGITPIASLLRDACARGLARDVTVLMYNRTYSDSLFADDLRMLARQNPGLRVHLAVTRDIPTDGDLTGHFSLAQVQRVAPDFAERETFVCGPRTLVDAVRGLWAERGSPTLLKTETFSPLPTITSDSPEASTTVRVSATRSARSFSANAASALLGQAEHAGLSPRSGCRQGICLSCTCRKRTGVVRNLITGHVSSEPDEDIRLCVSAPLSDLTLDL